VSGYDSRLDYLSLPPIPDQVLKDYLLGPLNDQLKTNGGCQLFDNQLAEWYVSKFGSNFVEMKNFILKALKGGVNREAYLSQRIEDQKPKFITVLENPGTRIILDNLVKDGSFKDLDSYTIKPLRYLIQENIVAKRAVDYTWNMRLMKTTYQVFSREQEQKQEQKQKQKQEKKKPWYRWF
jgi:hypothetical protein